MDNVEPKLNNIIVVVERAQKAGLLNLVEAHQLFLDLEFFTNELKKAGLLNKNDAVITK